MRQIRMNEQITVGGQPTEPDMQQLAAEGFRTIVNLRRPGESDQMLSPEEEGLKARQLGMEYIHLPVASKEMRIEQVDNFSERLSAAPQPAYVHCGKGGRAAMFAVLDAAEREGWNADEAIEQVCNLGYSCDTPEAQEFVRGYLRTRRR